MNARPSPLRLRRLALGAPLVLLAACAPRDEGDGEPAEAAVPPAPATSAARDGVPISSASPAGAPPPLDAPDPAVPPPPHVGPGPGEGTQVLDEAAAGRLLGAKGVTLQWLGWNERGPISVVREGGTIRLRASQQEKGGPGRLSVEGTVREIGADYFILDGTIRIIETPDRGRKCVADKPWFFAVTQNRPYWRLREFEWCDDLTDYVDIYF